MKTKKIISSFTNKIDYNREYKLAELKKLLFSCYDNNTNDITKLVHEEPLLS